MLFNSFAYLVFLPVVFVLYWALPHKHRWALILVTSYYFYMCWNVKYVFLILFTTVVSYCAARLLEHENSLIRKKWILAGTVVLCLGVLFFFKYFNFVSESISSVLRLFTIQFHPVTLNLLLPVGISFYTFQTMSYVVDVYRGDIAPESHFGKYAAFISFFPQLVAGPIERASNLLPQIKAEHKFDYNQATYGLKLMAWGFFKKIAIADTLSKYVHVVFDPATTWSYQGFSLVLSAVFFSFQIYCDFSGYSDIAIGTAKLMGIDLMTNFKSPYFSQSVKEFWSRWHISLSTWFRDYVYIPLGGNRVGKVRHSLNLMITFLVSGLWHGASKRYILWGGIHGFAQILENSLIPKKYQKSRGIPWLLRVILVFTFCTFTWIFFTSGSIGDALYIIGHLFSGISSPVPYIYNGLHALGLDTVGLIGLCIPILVLMIYDYVSLKTDVIALISSQKVIVRWTAYFVVVLWVIWAIMENNVSGTTEFIYFQF